MIFVCQKAKERVACLAITGYWEHNSFDIGELVAPRIKGQLANLTSGDLQDLRFPASYWLGIEEAYGQRKPGRLILLTFRDKTGTPRLFCSVQTISECFFFLFLFLFTNGVISCLGFHHMAKLLPPHPQTSAEISV